ncbi:MAG TPA: hypothetical protein VFY40_25500 [Blastocatellia bacterium]|nr:hypothetical protein [Blastocatellia bacterium]
MTRKFYALSGVFLIVLVVAGLWASKAGGFTDQDPIDPLTTRKFNGVSMEDMARGADRIVIGKCTGTRSEWSDNGRHLVTRATVEVSATLKGAETESVLVEIPGGRGSKGKFQLAMTYPGAATIAENETVALFLVPATEGADTYAVMDAGKFSIVQDVDDKPVVTSVPMKVRAPRATGLTSGNQQVIELSEFKAMIEGYLK